MFVFARFLVVYPLSWRREGRLYFSFMPATIHRSCSSRACAYEMLSLWAGRSYPGDCCGGGSEAWVWAMSRTIQRIACASSCESGYTCVEAGIQTAGSCHSQSRYCHFSTPDRKPKVSYMRCVACNPDIRMLEVSAILHADM